MSIWRYRLIYRKLELSLMIRVDTGTLVEACYDIQDDPTKIWLRDLQRTGLNQAWKILKSGFSSLVEWHSLIGKKHTDLKKHIDDTDSKTQRFAEDTPIRMKGDDTARYKQRTSTSGWRINNLLVALPPGVAARDRVTSRHAKAAHSFSFLSGRKCFASSPSPEASRTSFVARVERVDAGGCSWWLVDVPECGLTAEWEESSA